MRMSDDLADLDAYRRYRERYSDADALVLARRDQALAEVRASAQVVQAYLEGLENENVPEPLRSDLVRDFAAEYWRQQWPAVNERAARSLDE